MWERLLPPLAVELDPETQAIVDEVCGAMEWYDESEGSVEYMRAQQFGEKWYTAYRHTGDPICRGRIIAACEALIAASGEFVATDGRIYPREQIAAHRGRIVYLPDGDTGEMRRVLQWPAGTYASGEADYSRKGDRNAA